MMIGMAYDLHTHSKISDGTQTVAELVRQVAQTKLTGFALTDHDTSAGWAQAAQEAEAQGLDFVPGMEISCTQQGLSIHLLSYFHDPNYQPLVKEIQQARQARLDRAHRMVDLISRDYPISWEQVQKQAGPGATLGRPHIADALLAAGLVADRSQAFATILAADSPYYLPYEALNPSRAVELVRAAGGVPVLAHPKAANRGAAIPSQLIREMIQAGLLGLEVYHRDNGPQHRLELSRLAEQHHLLITGSSDYHGAGKPNQLGEHTTSDQTLARIRQLAGQPES